MLIKKSIQLTTAPFDDLIKYGEAVDFRLDEPAWAELNPEDHIQFWEDLSGWDTQPSAEARKITVKIEEIVRATTFANLIDTLPAAFVAKESRDDILTHLREWWTAEKEQEMGVLGFKVRVVSLAQE